MSDTPIYTLLDRAIDVDPDLRFMALNDLNKVLSSKEGSFTGRHLDGIAEVLFKGLDDGNSDVQAQAIKCFGPYIKVVNGNDCVKTLIRLSSSNKTNSITTSVETMALRLSLQSLMVSHEIARRIIVALLPSVQAANIDFLEILADLIKYLGVSFTVDEVVKTCMLLVDIGFQSHGIVAKRAIMALGSLFRYVLEPNVPSLLQYITSKCGKSDYSSRSTRLLVLSTLLKAGATKLGPFVSEILDIINTDLLLEHLDDEPDLDEDLKYNELRDDSLMCLESLIPIGYSSISPHLQSILDLLAIFLTYDPFPADEDEDNIEEDDEIEFSDEEFEEEEDSDDISWRLRKEAAKIVGAIVTNYPSVLNLVYGSLASKLVARLEDSNDSVSEEAIRTIILMVNGAARDGPYYHLKYVNGANSISAKRGSDASMQLENDPYSMLNALTPSLIASFITALSKNKNLKQVGLFLSLSTSLTLVNEGLESGVEKLLKSIYQFNLDSNLAVSIELIRFYSALFRTNSLESFGAQLSPIGEDLLQCLNSSMNTMILEGLDACSCLFNSFTTETGVLNIDFSLLLQTILDKMANKNYSGDLRRRALSTLADLLYNVPVSEISVVLSCLKDCLSYESIAESTVICIGKIGSKKSKTQLPSTWINGILDYLVSFLGSSDWALQSATLETLISISTSEIEAVKSNSVVSSIIQHIPYNDRSQLNLFLTVLGSYISSSSIDEVLINSIVGIFDRVSKIEEIRAQSLISISSQLVSKLNSVSLYQKIMNSADRNNSIIAKVLASIALKADMNNVIAECESELKQGINLLFNLQFLGYIGEFRKLNIDIQFFSLQFDNDNEEVKLAAGKAIGSLISRDLDTYLSSILEKLVNDKSHRMLLLTALQENLNYEEDSLTNTIDESTLNMIWDAIFKVQESQLDIIIENECVLTGNCISSIILASPLKVNELARVLETSKSFSTFYTIIAAVKQLLSYNDMSVSTLLSGIMIPLLQLISIESIPIKQGLLGTFVTALHNKPGLILPILNEVLAKIYIELDPRKEFVKVIQMGPFKHKIDEGIEIRKIAYEFLYSIISLETRDYGINYEELLRTTIEKGLKDDHEIIILSCVIITGLCKFAPELLFQDQILNNFIEKSLLIVDKKLKDNTPKQQVEKQQDAIRSVIKSSKKIHLVIEKDTFGISAVELSNWSVYYNHLRTSNADLFNSTD